MSEKTEHNVLDNIKALSKRNEKLKESLEGLINNYQSISDSEKQYQNLLREFGLQEETGREKKNVKRFKMASLCYIVVHGFTRLNSCSNASYQLDKLDEILFTVQDIAQNHNLIKINTVGDNILLAGGIQTENKTNPVDVSMAAYRIMEAVKELKQADPELIWNLSLGLHTGPVLARYTQGKKLPYTISGGNVLTSTRIAYVAPEGSIAMSPMTNELTKEFFNVEKIGKMPVKYSGQLDVFELKNIHNELANPTYEKSSQGIMPWSEDFSLAYQRLQFMDIQEYILDMLEERLPKNLYYHNVKHTIDVTTEVELIGWAEGLPESQILLLKVAGLFHDSGHIICYKGHEQESCNFVQEILPRYGYAQEKIDEIKRIIMATQLPHTPQDILEAVIQDSDLDYLGRGDFLPVSDMLFKELKERNATFSVDEWNLMQIKFISAHQYYTNTAKALREVNKQSQIERIRSLLPEDMLKKA